MEKKGNHSKQYNWVEENIRAYLFGKSCGKLLGSKGRFTQEVVKPQPRVTNLLIITLEIQ